MSLLTTEELLEGFWGYMIGNMMAVFFVLCQIWGNRIMGKSGICKSSTLAIWSGDVLNTSMSNCGNMEASCYRRSFEQFLLHTNEYFPQSLSKRNIKKMIMKQIIPNAVKV